MSQVATLSKGAAILLLHFIELGGSAAESVEDTMEVLGYPATNVYYRNRKELVLAGLLTKQGYVTLASVQPTVAPTTAAVEPSDVVMVVVDERTWREQAMAADLMPFEADEDAKRRPSSAFQARRRAQVAVLQAAWKASFNQELLAANAKSFLTMTGDYAEDVIDAIEKTQNAPKRVEFPMSYIKSILANARPRQPGAQQAGTGPVEDGALMADYTPETKRKAEWVKAYVAAKGDDGWDD